MSESYVEWTWEKLAMKEPPLGRYWKLGVRHMHWCDTSSLIISFITPNGKEMMIERKNSCRDMQRAFEVREAAEHLLPAIEKTNKENPPV